MQASASPSPNSLLPTSFLDASIPFNLPPRRSMKMLKDGSDFVWPDAAHSLFVKGLQAWKILTIGSKRTRAPRGEGKTDFLVRYLANHGVERTKKQVASHLQVLRTEWRNLDNPVLLSLVDEIHTRSLSEPSLPAPTISLDASTPVFESSPGPADDQSVSSAHTPPASHTTTPPVSSASALFSSLQQPDPIYSLVRSHSVPEVPLCIHSSPDVTSAWQLDPSVWHAPTSAPSTTTYYTQQQQAFPHNTMPYQQEQTFHAYDQGTRLAPFATETSPLDYFSSALYGSRPPLPALQTTASTPGFISHQQPLFSSPVAQQQPQPQPYSAPSTVDTFPNLGGFESNPFATHTSSATASTGLASFQFPSQPHSERRQSPQWGLTPFSHKP